jgi:hypothetical protein
MIQNMKIDVSTIPLLQLFMAINVTQMIYSELLLAVQMPGMFFSICHAELQCFTVLSGELPTSEKYEGRWI